MHPSGMSKTGVTMDTGESKYTLQMQNLGRICKGRNKDSVLKWEGHSCEFGLHFIL